jgi:antitoxin MazE
MLETKGVRMMQTAIVKWGNPQEIRLPKILLDSVNLSDDDMVEVTAEDNRLIIKKPGNNRSYKTIQERFEDFDGEYEQIEIDWGEPVGKELW